MRYPAAISIGLNPTFDDVPVRQVEAYVLDETDLDLYGRDVEIQFVSRIRGMAAFEGVEALVAQITDDVEPGAALALTRADVRDPCRPRRRPGRWRTLRSVGWTPSACSSRPSMPRRRSP